MSRSDLSIIVGTRDIEADGSICTTWTCETVGRLIGWQAEAWCRARRLHPPIRLHESLTGYLYYLRDTRLLTERSDSLADLLDEIDGIAHSRSPVEHGSSGAGRRYPFGRPSNPSSDQPSERDCRVVQLRPKKSSMTSKPS